jgi:hypothetical protein
MKFDLTVVYKSTENTKDYFIKRDYKNIDLNINTKHDFMFDAYYLIDDKRLKQELNDKLNLNGIPTTLVTKTEYMGDGSDNLSFIVEAIVPNKVMRRLKIESVLV